MASPGKRQEILFIDDDILPTRYYLHALRRKYLVTHESMADEARNRILAADGVYALIILDIMMPPVEGDEDLGFDKTHEGLETGVCLHRLIKRHMPDTPVVVLTNVADQAVLAKLGPPSALLKIRQKRDCTPKELLRTVEETVARTP